MQARSSQTYKPIRERDQYIIQAPYSFETRSVLKQYMIQDCSNGFVLCESRIENLIQFKRELGAGIIPVGSVEFVRQAMKIAGVCEPKNDSYPEVLKEFLGRSVKQLRAGSVIGRYFIKPIETKIFNGFVFDTLQDPEKLDEHDREAHEEFMKIHADQKVWISEEVNFSSEWRYYVMNGQIIGKARYDQSDDEDVPAPDESIVNSCIELLNPSGQASYALDMGVLECGETVLVEKNDAWAIGLYKDSLTSAQYCEFLKARWEQILQRERFTESSENSKELIREKC